MLRALAFIVAVPLRAIRALCRSGSELVLENLVLRQQIIAPLQKMHRLQLDMNHRTF
jgi:hypothetical protein